MRRSYPRHREFNIDDRLADLERQHDKQRDSAREAVASLRRVDPDWEKWYDKTIQTDATFPEITLLVSRRLAELNYMHSHPTVLDYGVKHG